MKGLRIGRRRARGDGLPSSPLELALIPALSDERWQVPDRFNFTRDVVEALANDPKRRALTFLGKDGVIEPRTFMQISEGAALWAKVLREHGIQPEDRVIVLAGSGVDWLEILLGVIKVGAVAVPCSPGMTAAALEVRVSSTEAALIVAEESCRAEIAHMSFTPDVHYVHEGRQRRSSDAPADAPTHDTSSRELALILSTSGNAGAPKGVAHSHGSIFATRVAAEHWLDAGRGDAVWCTAPSDSPQAFWSALAGPWSRGAEVVLHHGEFDPLERLDLLYRLGPTILCQSPAEYSAMAELRELERFRSPRLRRLTSTGDYLDPEVISAFEERWGMTIHDGYGQAETNVVVANGADAGFKPGSLGRPMPGHHVAIVDAEGDELPVGIEGDLAVRGRPPTLFAGYWESPEDTKGTFRGDWYLTGDVAMKDEDGFFWFVGRAEDVITSRGRTFGPYEVERALRDHDAIAASAVIGLRDLQRGGQFVRAYVVPGKGSEGNEQLEAELRQFVGQALPEQLVPREIVFVEELPEIGGKVSRHALRERPIGGRPLWELPPTSEPEAEEPSVAVQPPPAARVVAEAAPIVVPEPPVAPAPPPLRPPQPVVVSEPVVIQEPVVIPEPTPEPVAEAAPAPEPEPEPEPEVEPVETPQPEVLEPVAESAPALPPEPEPAPVAEPTPFVIRRPEPEAEAAPKPEPVAEAAPEPQPEPMPEPEPEEKPAPVVIVEPEPLPPAAEAAPAQEPEPDYEPPVVAAPPDPPPAPKPELIVVSEPEPAPLPDFVIEPSPEPVPPTRPEPEPVAVVVAPEPLPDFVVPPSASPEAPPPPPPPEPEPEPDLGPLPDYVVDPDRPPEPKSKALKPVTPAPPPFVETTSEPEPSPSGFSFPPAASFPVPRDDPDDDERKRAAPKTPRRRPAPEPTKSRRGKSGPAEPGDEAEEVSWMEGLSNRLSAYSLAEEGSDTSAGDAPPSDDDKDAKTDT